MPTARFAPLIIWFLWKSARNQMEYIIIIIIIDNEYSLFIIIDF